MAIRTTCPKCNQVYNLSEKFEGKKVRCKACGESFTVAGAGPPAPAEGAPRRGVRKAPAKAPARPGAEDPFAFDEQGGEAGGDEGPEEERPRRGKKKAKKGIPIWVFLLGGGGLLLLLCCGGGTGLFLYFGTDVFGTRVTQENFDTIKTGMTEGEVILILGAPSDTVESGFPTFPGAPRVNVGPGAKMLVWKGGPNTITVIFLNDKVVSKQGQFKN